MVKPYLAVEVLDSANTWQEITGDVMNVVAQGMGFYSGRERPGLYSAVGRMELTLRNKQRTYNPDVDATETALIECDRRVRVRYIGSTYGKALQSVHNGIGNAAYWSQTVNQAVAIGNTLTLTWEARAQFDSFFNTDHVQIVTSGESGTATLFSYTNKWVTYTLVLVAAVVATTITPTFIPQTSGAGTNATAVEYRNVALTLNGGANLLTNGNFASGVLAPWAETDSASVTGNAASYATSNQDSDVALETPSGPGGTITIATDGTHGNRVIGNLSGTSYAQAQRFKMVNGGYLDRFTFALTTNLGTPTGTMTWSILADSAGTPGAVISSGEVTPQANAVNQVNLPSRLLYATNDYFWVRLAPTTAQTANNAWGWDANGAGGGYTEGSAYWDGATWTTSTSPLVSTVTLVSAVEFQKLDQLFKNTAGVALTATKAQLYLKKVGSPAGTMTLRVETDSSGKASGTLLNANATATVAESSLTTSYALVDFTWIGSFSIPVGTLYHLVLSTSRPASATDYVLWGADGSNPTYTDGNLTAYDGSNWSDTKQVACFTVVGTASSTNTLTVIDDYKIRFNGLIDSIQPAPHAKGGPLTSTITCVDLTQILRKQYFDGGLQENKRGDELITTALSVIPAGVPSLTLPGKLLGTGAVQFPAAFDAYNNRTSILDAVKDVVMSEGPYLSFQWMDLDGTFRWAARSFLPAQAYTTPKITFAGKDTSDTAGDPFMFTAAKNNALRLNQTILTCYPRATITGPIVLAQITTAIAIPPKKADGSPGTTTVTLTYRDPTTQAFCGGKNVLNPVPTTDYLVYDAPDATTLWAYNYTTNSHFAMTVDTTGSSSMTITLKNYATGTLYATKLQCRGDALVAYDPIVKTRTHDDVTVSKKLPSPYVATLPFAGDPVFLDSLGDYLINRYHVPFMEAQTVAVDWRYAIGGTDLLDLELCDTVLISDPQVGMSAAKSHMITGVSFEMRTDAGGIAAGTVALATQRIDDTAYFILDDATHGKLDTGRLHI